MLKTISPSNVATVFANVTTAANATFLTSSLSLAPKGYIVVTINGTNQKIPYYDV